MKEKSSIILGRCGMALVTIGLIMAFGSGGFAVGLGVLVLAVSYLLYLEGK